MEATTDGAGVILAEGFSVTGPPRKRGGLHLGETMSRSTGTTPDAGTHEVGDGWVTRLTRPLGNPPGGECVRSFYSARLLAEHPASPDMTLFRGEATLHERAEASRQAGDRYLSQKRVWIEINSVSEGRIPLAPEGFSSLRD